MTKRDTKAPVTIRCAYIKCCYLAEALDCFGYKLDCVLYLKSNNKFYTTKAFDDAVNTLIDKAKAKYEKIAI